MEYDDDMFACIFVRDLVEEMVLNPNSTHDVYINVNIKRQFGKFRPTSYLLSSQGQSVKSRSLECHFQIKREGVLVALTF